MIRKATMDDIPRMLELFEQAKGIMRSDGNMHQWTGGYPSEEILTNDIRNGNAYVIVRDDGCVAATFAFIIGEDPTYRHIYEGEWLEDTMTYGTIHRLASGPDTHGVARECFDYCWNVIQNLRVDTHADNNIMQHCIQNAGFEYCGIIYLMNGDPRLAYQKYMLPR